jgi:hypothetical protein
MTAANAAPELIPKTLPPAIASQIVAGCSKRKRGSLWTIRPDLLAHMERDKEHDHEVDQQVLYAFNIQSLTM